MKKKGKCDFAHGPLELRINSNRRDKWGKNLPGDTPVILPPSYRLSGGEDSLTSARASDTRGSTGTQYQNMFENSRTPMMSRNQQQPQTMYASNANYPSSFQNNHGTFYPMGFGASGNGQSSGNSAPSGHSSTGRNMYHQHQQYF